MVKRDGDVVEPSEPSEEESRADLREHYDILLVRAPNPGPLHADGHEHLGRRARPAWVVDPGPAARRAPRARCTRRSTSAAGSAAWCSRTTTRTTPRPRGALAERYPAPLAAGRGRGRRALAEGARFGPFAAVATPGHAADHFALIAERRLLHRRRRARRGQRLHQPLSRRDGRLPARAHAPAPARRLQRALPRARAARVGRRRASSRSTSPTASTARTT